MLYILDPPLRQGATTSAARILDGMRPKLNYEPYRVVSRPTELRSQPDDVAGVVVFTPTAGRTFDPPTVDFLQHAVRSNAVVMPVALDASRCPPPEPITRVLAYQVDEMLSRRNLAPTAFEVAGDELARRLLAEMWPTCTQSKLQLFISYRLSDTYETASILKAALDRLQDTPVRDVDHFRSGRPVEAEILANLTPCDVLVFLDSPMARTSEWVAWELALAMGRGIPIVWVQLGDGGGRDDLAVWPSDVPDLVLPAIIDNEKAALEAADRIRQRAFDNALAHVRRACVTLDRIRCIDELSVTPVDRRHQIHCVSRKRYFGNRRLEPERHVIQVFGRHVSPADRQTFKSWFHGARSATDSPISGTQEAYLIASSTPSSPDEDEDVIATDHIEYVERQAAVRAAQPLGEPPELLLLAAFPRHEGSSQEIREAVRELTTTWLSRGGRLRFGGHPTITPLVDRASSSLMRGREAEFVTVYRSGWFEANGLLQPVETAAAVVETEWTADLAESLTVMRTRLIGDGSPAAVLAIGGRTDEGGTHAPGIAEEVELARRRGLPVYLLGRAGGYTASLIERCRGDDLPWASMGNALSVDENEELAFTDDYWRAASTIWNRHVS